MRLFINYRKKTFPPEYWPDDMAVNVQASAQATAQAVPNVRIFVEFEHKYV